MNLKKGEFLGRTTDEAQPFFWGRFKKNEYRDFYQMEPFVKLEGANDWQQVVEHNSPPSLCPKLKHKNKKTTPQHSI